MTQEERDLIFIGFDTIKMMADNPASDNLKEVLSAISAYAEMQKNYINDNWQINNNGKVILYGLSGT